MADSFQAPRRINFIKTKGRSITIIILFQFLGLKYKTTRVKEDTIPVSMALQVTYFYQRNDDYIKSGEEKNSQLL